MSKKPSKPWEKRPPGGREGAEWEERKASRPARGDPTCAWESLPAATGHAVSRRQDGDVSRRLYWIHNILACGMNRWLIWCVMFQSGEARCFCWPKTSSVQVWTEDSWQRDNGIFKSIPVISVSVFSLSNCILFPNFLWLIPLNSHTLVSFFLCGDASSVVKIMNVFKLVLSH